MTYSDTLAYLYSRLPMYQRIGAAAYKADLHNTIALCDFLGHPENKFRSIHVAGTNGKGSSSHMLAAILQHAGYKTGLYTSPHLKDFRERIRINGEMIPEAEVVRFVTQYRSDFEAIPLSFFEWTVGLCFDYFAREKVDVAVIETGLGGRLDSTNVILPEVSLITNVSFDHMNLLGDTLEKIAAEKAGIIKPGVPVVIGEASEPSEKIFRERAAATGSSVYFPSKEYAVSIVNESMDGLELRVHKNGTLLFDSLFLDLPGLYQVKNIPGVLETVSILQSRGWKISRKEILDALSHVKPLTGLQGRWQRISEQPLTICDVGHNEAGIREVVRQLAKISARKIHFVLGLVDDKDRTSVLSLLPKEAIYYFCKAKIPRALDAAVLKEEAGRFNLTGKTHSSVSDALHAAQAAAGEKEIVFVGGSTFVVAEVI